MKTTVFKSPSYAIWPSVLQIQQSAIHYFKKNTKKMRLVDINPQIISKKGIPAGAFKDDFWIFPPGTVDVFALEFLSSFSKQKNLKTIPPCVFFMTGESAKAGYFLNKYYKIIRPQDKIVVASQAELICLKAWFPRFENFYCMYFPLPERVEKKAKTKLIKIEKNKIRRKLGLPLSKKVILYAGRLSRQKNITQLIEHYKKDENTCLAIAGGADNLGFPHFGMAEKTSYMQEINLKVKQCAGLEVVFLGHLSLQDLLEVFSVVDEQISVSTHFGEDFGYSLVQGLTMGVPTSATAWGGHYEWIRAGFVAPIGVNLDLQPVGQWPAAQKASRSFMNWYKKQIKDQIKDIFKANSNTNTLVPVENLRKFNNTLNKEKRHFLFKDSKNPIYRSVVYSYLNFQLPV